MSSNRLGLLPRGERNWYPYSRCAFCGADEDLRPTIFVTFAEALVCRDVAACERRRYQRRHGIAA